MKDLMREIIKNPNIIQVITASILGAGVMFHDTYTSKGLEDSLKEEIRHDVELTIESVTNKVVTTVIAEQKIESAKSHLDKEFNKFKKGMPKNVQELNLVEVLNHKKEILNKYPYEQTKILWAEKFYNTNFANF